MSSRPSAGPWRARLGALAVAGVVAGCGGEEPGEVRQVVSPAAAASGVNDRPEAPTFDPAGSWPAADRAGAVALMLRMDPEARAALEDPSVLRQLQPPPEGLFDSLALATGGTGTPGAWRSDGVFAVGRGTAEVYADTASGWFTLVFRDSTGVPRWNPVFRPGPTVVGSSPARHHLYLYDDDGGTPELQAVRVRWRTP